MAIYVFAYILCSQSSTLLKQAQAGLMTSVSMSSVVLVPAELCMQPHIPVCAHLCGEHTHPSGAHTQLGCWLDLRIGTCGSLGATQLLNWAASNGIFRLAVLLLH